MNQPRVGIVGGGLAGLASAVALCEAGCQVTLFESRRTLGGRATSFRDPVSGQWVDHCQHVSLGCCTNLADFCRRTGIAGHFRRDRTLHFFAPDGRRYDLQAARWLPVPFHLAPALMRLSYLSLHERLGIGRTLLRLAWQPGHDDPGQPTIGAWLKLQRQTPRAIDQFWSPVLVSALGEAVDRASLAAARKVFVDAFMANRQGYELEVPTLPLSELYGTHLERWLRDRRVTLKLATAVDRIGWSDDAATSHRALAVRFTEGLSETFDFVILATAWRRVNDLLSDELRAALPQLARLSQIESAPISGIHLWFDRPITDLPHAVLLGTLSQWLFNRGDQEEVAQASENRDTPTGHYYQVVISASRDLAGRDRQEIAMQIHDELRVSFPAARHARLLNFRLVTEPAAVFSVRPGLDQLRPDQRTAIGNLFLAGDYTATGWPATMEGAVRSGYLAAEFLLASAGSPRQFLQPDLPRKRLVNWIIGSR